MHCHILPQKKQGDVHRAREQVAALRSKYYKEPEELQRQVRHLRQQIRDMNVSTTCHHWTVQCWRFFLAQHGLNEQLSAHISALW